METISTWLTATGLSLVVLAAYYGALVALALAGVHRLLLLLAARRLAVEALVAPTLWPRVTVQLPLYNERYVAARAIAAAAALDYPPDRLEIQVLDDSDDDTREVVATAVALARARGVDCVHLRRAQREGFKAGALAYGTARAKGELVAIFDADFVPPVDFLRRTVPNFADPKVGCVQARWGHLNRTNSLLTRVQALLLDGHFGIEHPGRAARGGFFNFNGTAGVWRVEAIRSAGGWTHETLTEDLDLSYRAQLAGWRFVYRPDVVVPAELPADLAAFKGQQDRWTRGSMQTARKLLPAVLRAPLAWRTKLAAAHHLVSNLAHVLVVVLAVFAPLAAALRWGDPTWQVLALDLPLLFGGSLAVAAYFVAAQRAVGGSACRAIVLVPVLMAVGIGMALHNARAAIGGLRRSGGEFRRTPKLALLDDGKRAVGKAGYRAKLGWMVSLEVALGAWLAVGFGLAIEAEMWSALPFLALFLAGPLLVATLSVRSRFAG